jgi:hypothetical protein
LGSKKHQKARLAWLTGQVFFQKKDTHLTSTCGRFSSLAEEKSPAMFHDTQSACRTSKKTHNNEKNSSDKHMGVHQPEEFFEYDYQKCKGKLGKKKNTCTHKIVNNSHNMHSLHATHES